MPQGRRWTTVLLLCLSAGCKDPVELQWRYNLGAATVSTPLVTESYIALGSERGLHVLELDGQERCVITPGEVISRPTTDGERIFFGSTNYNFYAVSHKCEELWRFPTRDRIKSDPLVSGGTVFFSSYDGHLYAVKAESGAVLWQFPAVAPAEVDPPAPRLPEPMPTRSRRGKQRTAPLPERAPSAERPEPKPEPIVVGDFSYSSPALVDGVLFIGNMDTHVYAIDASSGALVWRVPTNGPVTSSPAAHGDLIVVGSNDGGIYALGRQGGAMRWRASTRDWVNSSPRIVDGTVYIGGVDRSLYALNAATGTVTWKIPLEGPVVGVPAVYRNLVLVGGGSGDGRVYAFDRQTQQPFWTFETGGKVDADPVIRGERLYVASADHFLYSFVIHATAGE